MSPVEHNGYFAGRRQSLTGTCFVNRGAGADIVIVVDPQT